MPVRIKIRTFTDYKLDNFLNRIRPRGISRITYGFIGKQRYQKSRIPVAAVALIQEYGSRTNNIPSRPFFRNSQRKLRHGFVDQLKREVNPADMIVDKKIAKKLGEYAVNTIQQEIERLKIPRNAPATVKRKGFNNPLIETKKMQNSVGFKVE